MCAEGLITIYSVPPAWLKRQRPYIITFNFFLRKRPSQVQVCYDRGTLKIRTRVFWTSPEKYCTIFRFLRPVLSNIRALVLNSGGGPEIFIMLKIGNNGIASRSIVHKNKIQGKQPGWGFEPDPELSFPFKVTRL